MDGRRRRLTLKADGGVFQLPGADGTATSVGGGLTTPLAISAKSEHPDVAAAFLDFFTSEETSDFLYQGGWGMPGAQVSDDVAGGTDITSQVLALLAPAEAEGSQAPRRSSTGPRRP